LNSRPLIHPEDVSLAEVGPLTNTLPTASAKTIHLHDVNGRN